LARAFHWGNGFVNGLRKATLRERKGWGLGKGLFREGGGQGGGGSKKHPGV